MFERIWVSNFKSLVDFEVTLGRFSCLIGMNGAGKSTVLQAIDFLGQLTYGRVDDWLAMRDWDVSDLGSKVLPAGNTKLVVDFKTASGEDLQWRAEFNGSRLVCSRETILLGSRVILHVARHRLKLKGDVKPELILFDYQGSILSQLTESSLPDEVIEFRDALRRIRSLELLAPNLMRKRARLTDSDIGSGGEKLSAFLHGIKGPQRASLLKLLTTFYPQLVDFKVTSQRAGWKKLSVVEQFGDQKVETEARHINDGLLRVLAILAQTDSDRTLVLLDEIENGINPEIVEQLVDVLVKSQQQIVVTTHSPMILNYLADDVARESVQFIYKNPRGETRARPFFAIPRIGAKLEVMGPGEAFVDTDLLALTKECVALDDAEAANSDAELNTP